MISCKRRKQNIVALSSCEAEYIALSACVQEALYLNKLFAFMYGVLDGVVNIGVDNQEVIALAKTFVNQQKSKHIDVRYRFLRNVLPDGFLTLYYFPP